MDDEWLKSFEIRRELFLDEYFIMPNHLHAIVVLDKNNPNGTHVETHGRASLRATTIPIPININIATGVTIKTKPRPPTNIVPETPIYFIVYRRFQIVGQF